MHIEWRTVPGFDGYEINNVGDVRRSKHVKFYSCTTFPGRKIKPYQRNGHLFVRLFKHQRSHTLSVAKLVLLTFVGPQPYEGAYAVHLDTNPLNNRVDNLRWSTPQEGRTVSYAKITSGDARAIREARAQPNPPTLKELARRYGLTIRQVHRIARGDCWKDADSSK